MILNLNDNYDINNDEFSNKRFFQNSIDINQILPISNMDSSVANLSKRDQVICEIISTFQRSRDRGWNTFACDNT